MLHHRKSHISIREYRPYAHVQGGVIRPQEFFYAAPCERSCEASMRSAGGTPVIREESRREESRGGAAWRLPCGGTVRLRLSPEGWAWSGPPQGQSSFTGGSP